jgi:hypothetical protein
MTFIASKRGHLYESDLGEHTETVVKVALADGYCV